MIAPIRLFEGAPMDVKAVQAELARFAAERGWDSAQTPKNLAMALAIEASVVLELFKWQRDEPVKATESARTRDAAADAIADVILQALRLADRLGVDVDRAVGDRLARNAAKYPVASDAVLADESEVAIVEADIEPLDEPLADEPLNEPVSETRDEAPPVEEARAAAPPPEVAPAEPLPRFEPKPVEPAPRVEARPAEPMPRVEPQPIDPPDPRAETRITASPDSRVAPRRGESGKQKSPRQSDPEVPALTKPKPARVVEAPSSPSMPIEASRPLEPASMAPIVIPEPPPAPAPPAREVAPPPVERYPNLDSDAALALVKTLAKKLDQARSRDPLLRELHDELETLKRSLYAPSIKKAWVAGSLKTVRGMLEHASGEPFGEEIDAETHIVKVDRLLKE
jgi:NTP pyrophosphatase (non-canonical NTP hydrolase)